MRATADEARRQTGAAAGDALLHTSTPRAVLFSALTTVGSFGALATSGHRGTASMGLFLTIAIAMTLLCMLVLLPAMVAWRDRSPRRMIALALRRAWWTPRPSPA